MSRAVLILNNPAQREKASQWAQVAPAGTRVEFKRSKRTLPQNSRFWAMLTDIADQVTHHGMKLTVEDWKHLFLDALDREYRMVPNLSNDGFVALGRSSSSLTIAEMTDLIDMMSAFGAENGVVFNDREEAA